MVDEPDEHSPPEDQMGVMTFVVIFLGSPLLMGIAVTIVLFGDSLFSSPLGVALFIGHIVSGAALLGVYLVMRRRGYR